MRLPNLFRRTPPVVTRALPQTTQQENDVYTTVGGYLQRFSSQNGPNPDQARQFADQNPWVGAAVQYIANRVSRAERAIVPIDPGRPYDRALQAKLTWLLENPNPRGDSWRVWATPLVRDHLVLGKCSWEYVPNFRGWPLALYPVDVQWLHPVPDWDGRSPRTPRYIWHPRGMEIVSLRNDEITLILDNPSTHRTEGWSKVAILQTTIESDSDADDYVRSMLQKYPPPGWIDLGGGATAKQAKQVSEHLAQQVLGRGGMLVTANMPTSKFTSLWQGTSREQELRAWSEWFGRKVAVVFGLSPIDLGITSDVNRASASEQGDISSEGAVVSELLDLEAAWNREVIGKFGTPEKVNLALQFKDVTWADRLRRATLVSQLAEGVPTMQLNELRDLQHLEPTAGGNAIFVKTAAGAVAFLGEDARLTDVTDQQAAAAQDDEDAQSTPANAASSDEAEAVAGNKDPEGALDEDARAWVDLVTRAYLRLHLGTLDWTRELDAATVADLRAFALDQYQAALLRHRDPTDAGAVASAVRATTRLRRRLAPVTGGQPAYALGLLVARGPHTVSVSGRATDGDRRRVAAAVDTWAPAAQADLWEAVAADVA